jgi:predicted DNA binding CopG/RHH family protein
MTKATQNPANPANVSQRHDSLDDEEQEILTAYEAGKTTRVAGTVALVARHREYAEATFRKDARLNIRISSKDLRGLQKRALADGIPYQTLVASVLHKFVEGRLSERA